MRIEYHDEPVGISGRCLLSVFVVILLEVLITVALVGIFT